jgi:PAS domain S-box-containing protein
MNHLSKPASEQSLFAFLAGGGEMGQRTRAFDWSMTPVGSVADWPQSLKTAVSIGLGSRYPIVMWWGQEHLTMFYNDAYAPFLGTKHPGVLGRSARECWAEIWDIIGPMLEGVFTTGEATWSEDLLLVLHRSILREENYFTFSYSPIRDDSGKVGGVFCAVVETTGRVIGERRSRTLRDLGATLAQAKDEHEACVAAASTLATNPQDVPFALIYLIDDDDRSARLVATTGPESGSALAPAHIDIRETAESVGWPLRQVFDTAAPQLLSDVSHRFGPAGMAVLPGGLWPESPEAALIVPIAAPGQAKPTGFLVAGLSPRRVLTDDYRGFFDLVAGQIATAIANVRAYEAEKKRTEALAEIDRAKTAFFSNVSHEFRTPLTLILGPLEDALAETQERWQHDRLELVQRNALRLQKLVNTLLDFSRIEAGRIQACYEPTDLAALTRELASVFRSAVEKAGMRLVVACEPLSEPIYVDRDLYEKVVLNLLSNAFKFTLAGEIEIRLRDNSNSAELSVRDTGAGIADDQLTHIFERFHRVEGARARTHEGTGIGLALVQELVKLHGGTVAVESVENEGSTFTVTLPKGTAHLPADRIGAASRLASTGLTAGHFVEEALRWLPDGEDRETRRQGDKEKNASDNRSSSPGLPVCVSTSSHRPRVVWADDNADMREYVARLLRPTYDVEAVADGAAALAAVQQQPPELVLADVMMPRLDGFGLLRALRGDERTRTIPVILLSARAGEEARVEGMQAGADDYLIKPFATRELLARVESHVRMARARRESEQAARESEERFRTYSNAAPAILWVSNPDTRLEFISRGWQEYTGQSEVEAFGRDGFGWIDAVHPDDQEQSRRIFLEANSKRESFAIDYRLRRADGEYRWAIDSGRPRFDEHGEFRGYVGSVVDVHELALAREYAESIISGSPFGLYVVDADFRIAQMNTDAQNGAFINVRPVIGRKFDEAMRILWPEDVAAEIIRVFRRTLETGKPYYSKDFINPRADKQQVEGYEWELHQTTTPDGRKGVVCYYFDSTRLRQAEQALREADRRKDEFLATLAHELRNPLAPIRNSLHILRLAGDDATAAERVHEMMERQVNHMVRLVDDLMEVSRITRGKIELKKEPVELAAVVRSAVETSRPLIEAARHQLAISLPVEPLFLEADPVRLGQVLANLLNNAAKYTEEEGQIWLTARRDGPHAVISIRDNGTGIPDDMLLKVFDLFTQAERTYDRAQGGLGIGLTLVRSLVEMHGGNVEAKSDGPGRGSEFIVRLPCAVERCGGHVPGERAGRPAEVAPRRILVVDDNHDASHSLAMLLEFLGADVSTANDGPAALAALQTHQPSVVILDIGMPEMDGYEVARRVRELPEGQGVTLVALTGWGQDEDRRKSHEAGFDHHMTKPVDLTKLEKFLAEHEQARV